MWWLFVGSAWGFCGTYVAGAGAELYNNASMVVLSHSDRRTHLTLAMDVEGDVADFGVIIPIPEIVGRDDVKVVDREVLDRLDAYTSPRLVELTCADTQRDMLSASRSSACGSRPGSAAAPAEAEVVVHATFSIGEYDISVLTATGGEGLMLWLADNGFVAGAAAGPILDDYIEDGSAFVAARVSEGAQGWLQPLQISYESTAMSLPIRLGTANSPGDQDAIVVTRHGRGSGRGWDLELPGIRRRGRVPVALGRGVLRRPSAGALRRWTPRSCGLGTGVQLAGRKM